MARFTREEKESLFWATAYITDLMSGDSKAQINWDAIDGEAIYNAFYKLREEIQGF